MIVLVSSPSLKDYRELLNALESEILLEFSSKFIENRYCFALGNSNLIIEASHRPMQRSIETAGIQNSMHKISGIGAYFRISSLFVISSHIFCKLFFFFFCLHDTQGILDSSPLTTKSMYSICSMRSLENLK